MNIDKSDYYPYTPGSGQDEEEESESRESSEIKEAVIPDHVETETKEIYQGPEDNDSKDCDQADLFITRICNILSWVLVPMLVSVWGTIMMFNLSALSIVDFGTKLIFTLIVFGLNAVIPMGLVMILKAMKIVDDIGLNGRKERLIPYIIMILSYLATGFFFSFKGAPQWSVMFYFGAALAAFINMIVNFKWKISAHAAAVAGVVAMLLIIQKEGMPMTDLGWWTAGTILVSGLLGSARIWLGRHTLGQVLAGYAVGFLSVYLLGLV